MNKEDFVKMITDAEEFSSEIDRWNNFGINIIDLPIATIPWTMFDNWVNCLFNEEGADWINWYLFERKSIFTDEVLPCYDENNNKFYINTPDDLWELVKNYLK